MNLPPLTKIVEIWGKIAKSVAFIFVALSELNYAKNREWIEERDGQKKEGKKVLDSLW